jgi:2-dehydropantoate 2-reductase
VRILVLGAGVIGSVYAGKLLEAGHHVVLLARGPRLVDLQAHGLILEDAESGNRSVLPVPSVSEPAADDRFDLVLVPVRAEQLVTTLPVLTGMNDGSHVLFFGNTANRHAELTAALGQRALFGFPAAGGTRDGPVVKYVLINQQKTMLGEPDARPVPAFGTSKASSTRPDSPPSSAPTSRTGSWRTPRSSYRSRSPSTGSGSARPGSPPTRPPCG